MHIWLLFCSGLDVTWHVEKEKQRNGREIKIRMEYITNRNSRISLTLTTTGCSQNCPTSISLYSAHSSHHYYHSLHKMWKTLSTPSSPQLICHTGKNSRAQDSQKDVTSTELSSSIYPLNPPTKLQPFYITHTFHVTYSGQLLSMNVKEDVLTSVLSANIAGFAFFMSFHDFPNLHNDNNRMTML